MRRVRIIILGKRKSENYYNCGKQRKKVRIIIVGRRRRRIIIMGAAGRLARTTSGVCAAFKMIYCIKT